MVLVWSDLGTWRLNGRSWSSGLGRAAGTPRVGSDLHARSQPGLELDRATRCPGNSVSVRTGRRANRRVWSSPRYLSCASVAGADAGRLWSFALAGAEG